MCSFGEALGQLVVGAHLDPAQQLLHVAGGDPLRQVLLGQHLAVEQRDREQVGQRVVGLLLGRDLVLGALLAAADDVVGDLEGVELDPLHLSAGSMRVRGASSSSASIADCEWISALKRFRIVRVTDSRFSCSPVDLETAPRSHRMKPLLPSNTSRGPVIPRIARNAACVAPNAVAGYARPFQCDSAPVRVTRSAFSEVPAIAIALAARPRVEPERPGDARGDPVDALSGVVEPLCSHRRLLREPDLHLVGDRERAQQRAAVRVGVLRGGEHRRQVVRGMAGLARRQEGVVEVEVADERAVVERRPIGRGAFQKADHRRKRRAAELSTCFRTISGTLGTQGTERAPERVQDAQLELLARIIR